MNKKAQGAAFRAQRRLHDDAAKTLQRWSGVATPTPALEKDKLRIVPLGGQDGIGSKNMIVVEYGEDALVLDCGFDLGVDLPGINYAIPAIDYLRSIKHKLRGYVISHGHLDHIGGLPHIVPECPAPIYGSRFTIGSVERQFENATEDGLEFTPESVVVNMDTHERLKLGVFTVELVRVTHAIPESSAIVVDTPAGRLVNTGDFRLDPEPLDDMPTDVARLRQLGNEGVLLLMSESTNTTKPGRTPTEHTLQESFCDLIHQAPGRVFVGIFSTNMNRVQMIINAAAEQGRKVALDGRSMVATAELAVRLGALKIPKDTLIPMREVPNVPNNQVVVVCTGGQGEPNAALQRMSVGEHQYVKLRRGDTVVISSTPIPGNEVRYQQIGDDLAQKGVHLYRHPTHELDGCGPLHVSGHGGRDESQEMIELVQPQFITPIYGGPLPRKYHQDIAVQAGVNRKNIIMADNGDVIELGKQSWPRIVGKASHGSVLVDNTNAVVPGVVTKDRLLLQREGIAVVILTVNQQTGRLLNNPDIISRGFVYLRENTELLDGLRKEVRRFTAQHKASPCEIEKYKRELHDMVSGYLHHQTQRSPTIVPVVNVVSHGRSNVKSKPMAEVC